MSKLVYGKGVNDKTRPVSVDGKLVKEALCKQLALKWQSEIDSRLFNAMMNWEC